MNAPVRPHTARSWSPAERGPLPTSTRIEHVSVDELRSREADIRALEAIVSDLEDRLNEARAAARLMMGA